MLRINGIALAVVGVLVAGCGDDEPPVNAAGMYTVATTNGANDCMLMSWTVGETAMGIPVSITQNGSEIMADVGGAGRIGLDLTLGAHVFTEGHVSGNQLEATLFGTRSYNSGMCTATMNGEMSATLNGDVLIGTIRYVPQTNGSTECGVLNSCENRQDFNGTRPPSM